MKNHTILLVIALLSISIFSCNPETEEEIITPITEELDCTGNSTFTINLDASTCDVDISTQLGTASRYEETISGSIRTISVNSIASHTVGTFPNGGNPNTIREQDRTYSMPISPSLANSTTVAQGYEFGVLFSGVTMDPYTAEFFQTASGGTNRSWNITTLTSSVNLGLDCNNAHVQPTGKYHYHGTPSAFISDLNIDGSKMVQIGYAGDGFPIYYKYVLLDDGQSIIEAESGYQLIEGSRPGDGSSAPGGCYDGTYFQDYEYVDGISELDECNGRFGPTPNNPGGEYYYVITDNFPSSPLCFSGTPDNSFRFN